MRTLLFSAMAALALSACNPPPAHDTRGEHAGTTAPPAPASNAPAGTPERNVPGGGSGTAASEQQESGDGNGRARDASH